MSTGHRESGRRVGVGSREAGRKVYLGVERMGGRTLGGIRDWLNQDVINRNREERL